MTTVTASSHPSEAIFTGTPAWIVHRLADRYDYKKVDGDADTRNQEDTMEI